MVSPEQFSVFVAYVLKQNRSLKGYTNAELRGYASYAVRHDEAYVAFRIGSELGRRLHEGTAIPEDMVIQ